MNTEVRILHEAASQRQYLRLKTPLLVDIKGETYATDDWSVGGLRIVGFTQSVEVGDTIDVVLRFPFEGFDMTMEASAVVRHISLAKGILGVAFDDMPAQRLSLLRFVTDSYLSGEAVNAGDVLQIVERDNSARARASQIPDVNLSRPAELFRIARRNFGLVLLAVAALALLAYVAVNLYARTFTVAGDGAITSPQGTVLRAQGAGVVIGFAVRPGDRVQPGQLLASLQRLDGRVSNLTSSCDCVVGERLAEIGSPIAKAAPILSLAPTNGITRATLVVRLKDIRKVRVGDRVAVQFFNADEVSMGRVSKVNLPGLTDPTTLQQSGLKVPDLAGSVEVRFDNSVNALRVGQPVSGRIRLLHLFPSI